jgi:hypothetical protein
MSDVDALKQRILAKMDACLLYSDSEQLGALEAVLDVVLVRELGKVANPKPEPRIGMSLPSGIKVYW